MASITIPQFINHVERLSYEIESCNMEDFSIIIGIASVEKHSDILIVGDTRLALNSLADIIWQVSPETFEQSANILGNMVNMSIAEFTEIQDYLQRPFPEPVTDDIREETLDALETIKDSLLELGDNPDPNDYGVVCVITYDTSSVKLATGISLHITEIIDNMVEYLNKDEMLKLYRDMRWIINERG